jgi:hypothetical protein
MATFACYQVEMYGAAFTSWMVTQQSDEIKIRPQHHPDRKDAISFIAVSRDKKDAQMYLDEGDHLGPSLMREGANFSGSFFNLLPSPGSRDKIPKEAAEMLKEMGKKAGAFQEIRRKKDVNP